MRQNALKTELKNRLNHINWDFGTRLVVNNDEVFPFNNRKYHSYPATFIPEIPFTLIEILSSEGAVVMDPFGGVGTTLVQALIQKRIPISIDNNSVASQITRDFFVLFNPLVDIKRSRDRISQVVRTYDENMDYGSSLSSFSRNLEPWYEKKTLNQVAFLLKQYEEAKKSQGTPGVIELFHLCLSNLLTTVCSQNGGWAYIADNVRPKADKMKEKNAIERFLQNINICEKSIRNYKEKLGDSISFIYQWKKIDNVICTDYAMADMSKMIESVDLIITSPPYPKMIDYVKSQRLSFYMEEREFTSELATEIGARARRNQSNTICSYIDSMKKCNTQMVSSLKKGGYLCYVLPDFSKEKDRDRKEAVDEVLYNCISRGMKEEYRIKRCIPGTQRSNNIKWASLRQEQIIILEKL